MILNDSRQYQITFTLSWKAATETFFALCQEVFELAPSPAGLTIKLGAKGEGVRRGLGEFSGIGNELPPSEFIAEPGVL